MKGNISIKMFMIVIPINSCFYSMWSLGLWPMWSVAVCELMSERYTEIRSKVAF